jgi:two-component system sensor histidine kinase CpxA
VEITISKSPGVVPLARIVVRDHGPGVPESDLEAVFRPFYRVASARDRQSGGVGLGLAITQRFVQRSGGRVRAVNAAGGGLEVLIELPVEKRSPIDPCENAGG